MFSGNELAGAMLAGLLFGGGPTKPKQPRGSSMPRVFNAFQIVALFSGMPYLIGWLAGGPFPFSVAALWTAVVTYIVMFGGLIISTANSLGEWR